MPVNPKTMRVILERTGRDMPSQATAPTVVPDAPVRPPMPPQAAQSMPPQGMPPQGMPPQAGAMPPQAMGVAMPPQGMPPQGMPPQGMPPQGMPPQGMPPRGPMMKRGGSVKSSSKPASKKASKPRGVGIAQRGFGCGGKVKMR